MVWCDVMNVMLQALAGEVLHWWCSVMLQALAGEVLHWWCDVMSKQSEYVLYQGFRVSGFHGNLFVHQ